MYFVNMMYYVNGNYLCCELKCAGTSLIVWCYIGSETRTYELVVVNVTRSNKAESSLLLRLAQFVVIRDPY